MSESRFAAIFAYVARCRSLRLGEDAHWHSLQRIDSVAIVGSTCAGKTTMCNAIRGSKATGAGRVVVPVRYITRSRRHNDDSDENVHISASDFADRVADGDIAIAWIRQMENGRQVRYGFGKIDTPALPVYSGNNAIYDTRAATTMWPADAFEHSLMVGVYAPDAVRESRLRRRSPDLWRDKGDEVAHRLADRAANVLSHAGVIVDNYGDLEKIAPVEVVGLIEMIAASEGG